MLKIKENMLMVLQTKEEPPYKDPRSKTLNKITDMLDNLSDASNIGIVLHMIASWWPLILRLPMFAFIVYIADPLIYIFKIIIRVVRAAARKMGLTAAEEEYGVHKNQTAGDIVALALFALVITLFFLGLGPVGEMLGWCVALAGLAVVFYFDFYHRTEFAKAEYEKSRLSERPIAVQNEDSEKREDFEEGKETRFLKAKYEHIKFSRNLFVALLVGLCFLLVFGAAAAFAPPVLSSIFFVLSKIASVHLAIVFIIKQWHIARRPKEESVEDLGDVSLLERKKGAELSELGPGSEHTAVPGSERVNGFGTDRRTAAPESGNESAPLLMGSPSQTSS
jgi:hypothetical protein